MTEENQEELGGPKLDGLGDVQREMVRVYRLMRAKRMALADGNGLIFALNCLASLMQDKRDSLHKKRLAVLWKEREQSSAVTQ